MEIGIDSFARNNQSNLTGAVVLENLLDRIEQADEAGLHTFGIGEYHRKEFFDSAPAVILTAAATRTKRIRLEQYCRSVECGRPGKSFQEFATLDQISKGRAELVVGRGSFTEVFPYLDSSWKITIPYSRKN